MSVPVTAAAARLSLAEAAGEGMGTHEAAMFLAGSISSAVIGYLAIRFLLRSSSTTASVSSHTIASAWPQWSPSHY